MEKLIAFFRKNPLLGARTSKTVLAVILSSFFMQYVLRQSAFFACIGAVVAMERTMSLSIKAAIIRNAATVTGGLIGIIIASHTESILVMSLGLIALIWVSNALGRKESIVPGAIVYFAVFYLNDMDSAWIYGLTRIMGTLIGTLIALAVNYLLFPPDIQDSPLENNITANKQ